MSMSHDNETRSERIKTQDELYNIIARLDSCRTSLMIVRADIASHTSKLADLQVQESKLLTNMDDYRDEVNRILVKINSML